MDTDTLTKTARSLMEDHGLNNWQFGFHSRKTQIATCFPDRRILYSKYYLNLPDEEIIDTILHEIAHALVGCQHGHNSVWKNMAIRIGARPFSCKDVEPTTSYNFVMECPNCDNKWYRYRMRQRNFGSICPDCKVEVKIYRLKK